MNASVKLKRFYFRLQRGKEILTHTKIKAIIKITSKAQVVSSLRD